MNALKQNTENITYKPTESKKPSKHVTLAYLEPFIGDIHSENNIVKFINKDDNGGYVSGDLVTWTKNYVGEEYLGDYDEEKYVKVAFPSGQAIKKGDTFECITRAPTLVNDKIKFGIMFYEKTGEQGLDTSRYDERAKAFAAKFKSNM